MDNNDGLFDVKLFLGLIAFFWSSCSMLLYFFKEDFFLVLILFLIGIIFLIILLILDIKLKDSNGLIVHMSELIINTILIIDALYRLLLL